MRVNWLMVVLGVGLTATSMATMIVPRWPDRRPMPVREWPVEFEREKISIEIRDEVAEAVITHVVRNRGNTHLEAEYLYPIPPDATVRDFAVELDGKRLDAELLNADKAEKIYQDIVRTMKDPGLLTYHDSSFLRVRAFPVPPGKTQKVEMRLAWPLRLTNGGWRLAVPLLRQVDNRRNIERNLTVSIASRRAFTNPYSPTHQVEVARDGDTKATVTLKSGHPQAREFVLLIGKGKDGMGAHLVTGHDRRDKDSEAFMLIAAPELVNDDRKRIPRDVIFAFDTSGSMAGDKLRQAKEALTYCLHQLEDDDRFAMLRFSTEVESWEPELQPLTKTTRKDALAWVEELRARGGTNVAGAVRRAAEFADGGRPTVILFLTDGKPTVGTADTDEIVAAFTKDLPSRTRLFAFGVGHQLNAHLLDKLSQAGAGDTRFVAPEADIEVAVSELYDAISHPVLTSPELSIDGVKVTQRYPQELPDLFARGQLTILGRYAGGGKATVKLSGEVAGEKKDWQWVVAFPERGGDNEFVAPIWAKRKIGYLLDAVRLNGESKELKEEITVLGRRYGVVTPYTSYLAVEDEPVARLPRTNRPVPPGTPLPIQPLLRREVRQQAGGRDSDFGSLSSKSSTVVAEEALEVADGAAAIQVSEAIRKLKRSDADAAPAGAPLALRLIGKREFQLVAGEWREQGVPNKPDQTIIWGSGEFFDLQTKADDELQQILELGQNLLFRHNGRVIRIESAK